MSRKSILHSNIPIRGSETTQLDISLGFKNWCIHKLIIISPLLITLLIYLFYKLFYLSYLMANNKNIDYFKFIDNGFFIVISIGILLTLTIGIKLGNLWNKKIKEADELITKDEYIRGSKLVCIDDFNKQFKDDDEFIFFKIQNDKCEREF
jgi:hypothetical protein